MEPFGAVLIVVVLVAIVAACLSYLGSGGVYRGLGRTGLSLDEPDPRSGPPPGSPAAAAEAREEVRQMLEAKSALREARGEAPLDVEAEMAALASPPAARDAALREEVRQLVVARNERRQRRGEEPLDVEAEVQRSLDELGAPQPLPARIPSPRTCSRPATSDIQVAMADERRYETEELLVRPGTYFNPQTEVLVVVDDSAAMDNQIFNLEEFEGADWVLVSDESPVDEAQRDELLESFQATYHGGDGRQTRAMEDPEADEDAPPEGEDAAGGGERGEDE